MAKNLLSLVMVVVLFPSVGRGQSGNIEPVNAVAGIEEAARVYLSLKKAPEEIESSGMVFGDKMREAIVLASPETVAQMKLALVDVLLTLNRIKGEGKLLKVAALPAGKEVVEAAENYLKQQDKTISESGPEIIRIAADSTLAAPDKKAKIGAIIEVNRKGSAVVETQLNKALTVFARENGLVELREFRPLDQSCKVQMPDITENKITEANGVKNTYFLAEDKDGVFMLSYADIAPASEDEAAQQKRLEEGKAGMIKKLGLKVTREAPALLAGKHPGRELEGDLPDNKTYTRINLFIVNGRLYQLWVVGPPSWAASPQATRFLNSLELLK